MHAPVSNDIENSSIDPQVIAAQLDPTASNSILHLTQSSRNDAVDSRTDAVSCLEPTSSNCEPTSSSCKPTSSSCELQSLSYTSIVSRCVQLEQENSQLCAGVLELKQKIDTFNSHVQRLNLSLLNDYQVQMYTGLPQKVIECLLLVESCVNTRY